MSLRINRSNFKDRIIENVAKAIKTVQEIQIYHTTDDPVVLSSHDRPARKLLEHLDHVLLHGLRHITDGYWKVVAEFSTKDAVKEIKRLKNVATNLGRGRAWLYMALNEGLMESYFRCFEGNLKLVKKCYVRDALVLDQQRLNVLLTLISGIELVVFRLDYDVTYLDLDAVPPQTRSHADSEESDRLSLCSMDSTASSSSRNVLLSRDSPIPVHDGKQLVNGHLNQIDEDFETKFDRLNNVIAEDVEPEDTSIEVIHVKRSSGKAKKHKNKKKEREPSVTSSNDDTSNCDDRKSLDTNSTGQPEQEQYKKIENLNIDVKPFYKLTMGVKEEDMVSPEQEKEILGKILSPEKDFEKSLDISEKSQSGDEFIDDDYLHDYVPDSKSDFEYDSAFSEKVIEKFQNKHKVSLSRGDDVSQRDKTSPSLDRNSSVLNNNTHKSAISEHSTEIHKPATLSSGDHSSKVSENSPKSSEHGKNNVHLPNHSKNSNCHDDKNNLNMEKSVQSTNDKPTDRKSSISEAPNENFSKSESTNEKSSTSEMQDLVDSMINQSDVLLKHHMYEEEPEDTKLDDSLNKKHDTSEGEIKLDNNTLLYLMLDVFDSSEEQFVKIFATAKGHTEGESTTVFLTLTDRSIYFLSQKQSDHRFYKDVSIPFNTIDYISVGIYGQTLHIVCKKRRNQYWITTGNQTLTNAIIDCITITCKENHIGPIPMDTDATTQKIVLKKYIGKESPNEDPSVCCYSLVHWDTPTLKGTKPETLHQEGHLLYKLQEAPGMFYGTQILQNPVSLIYGQSWKPAYVVLKDGLLCIYNDKNDSKPALFVQVGGEECTGCRRATDTDREHCIQIIKSDGSSIQLALASGLEASDWLQSLCQAVAEGIDHKASQQTGCMSCCLVMSQHKILMCHEDLQSSFYRTLGSANILDITSVLDDSIVKTYCILVFESNEDNVTSDPWVLHFNAETEKLRFIQALSDCWKDHFQVEIPVLKNDDFSLEKNCREMAFQLRDKMIVKKS